MQQSDFNGVVYLTTADYNSLVANGSITKSGQTLTYNRATLYVTTDTSLSDFQVDGTSVVVNNVANIITKTAYDASTNKIVTESDIQDVVGNINTVLATLTSGTGV